MEGPTGSCRSPTGCLDWVTPSPCGHSLPSLPSPCHLLPRGGPSELICGQAPALGLLPWGSTLFWADDSDPSLQYPLLSLGLGISLCPQPTSEPLWPPHHLFCC